MTFRQLATWLESDLAEVRAHMARALEPEIASGQFARVLCEAAENSGKMLRPILMLLVAGDYDEAHRDELLVTAACYELGHTASLILDDVIDGASLRRGKPSVQSSYGEPVALCTSDYLLMAAQGYLVQEGYARSVAEMARLVRVMCAGEMVQYEHLHDCAATRDTYLAAVRRKTASLFESCCGLAALITGKSDDCVAAMRAFGETLGVMFQVRDDLKDWTDDEQGAGKPVNEDFSEGIYTLPAIHAFANDEVGDRLRELASIERPSAGDLAEARRLVTEAGGIEHARAYLEDLAEQAGSQLAVLPEGPHRDALRGIVRLVAHE
ncbi:MAG: polyprenyl synthetase family protein [Olsenella sp.]|nr:polyprenyl synthetase family protein [Olsenella sp.]